MSWNYRVIRIECGPERYYSIHECHYEKPGDTIPNSWAADPATVGGETIDEMRWALSAMMDALTKPVLEETDDEVLREVQSP